jgi:CheY-like chemotaxis protein/HAMP domain-containing protein
VRAVLARLSARNWSLRTRLLAGVVGLVAIALVTTGIVGVTMLRSYLVQQIDQQLAVGATAMSRAPTARPAPPPIPRGEQLPTPFWFTDLAADGTVVRQRGGSLGAGEPKPDLSGVTTAKVRQESGRAFTVPSTTGGSGFRVRAVEQSDGGANVVAISLHSVDATVHRLELITWLVASVVLAVLIALATVAVWIGLRPLESVERTAQDIAAGDLSKRVPSGPSGTEIGRLSNTLNAMLAQIESAFGARQRSEMALRQFIADASHELRTPLTTVRGCEVDIADLLATGLRFVGFDVRSAHTGAQALAVAADFRPQLVVLDVMLPDVNGFELCRQLRRSAEQIGVVFLTARDRTADAITGLAIGGDDYISKPFSLDEVVARVRAVLRRIARSPKLPLGANLECCDSRTSNCMKICTRSTDPTTSSNYRQRNSRYYVICWKTAEESCPSPKFEHTSGATTITEATGSSSRISPPCERKSTDSIRR